MADQPNPTQAAAQDPLIVGVQALLDRVQSLQDRVAVLEKTALKNHDPVLLKNGSDGVFVRRVDNYGLKLVSWVDGDTTWKKDCSFELIKQ